MAPLRGVGKVKEQRPGQAPPAGTAPNDGGLDAGQPVRQPRHARTDQNREKADSSQSRGTHFLAQSLGLGFEAQVGRAVAATVFVRTSAVASLSTSLPARYFHHFSASGKEEHCKTVILESKDGSFDRPRGTARSAVGEFQPGARDPWCARLRKQRAGMPMQALEPLALGAGVNRGCVSVFTWGVGLEGRGLVSVCGLQPSYILPATATWPRCDASVQLSLMFSRSNLTHET